MDHGHPIISFNLIHISTTKHKGVDGLSRRPLADEDPLEDNDYKDWIDRAYSFGVAILNDRTYHITGSLADIICHTHYHCYTVQVVHTPAYRVFLDIVQEDGPEPSILHSETAQALDTSLIRMCEFLISHKRPTDLSDHEFAVFVHHVVHFFVREGNLWHREPHGRHQLVAQPHKHFRILKEAHDDLGHKGIYVTRVHLLLCFWWPHIIKDIKWYAKMCHECRTQQMLKLHIPSTVPIPGGLYCKTHIDTIKMPKAGRFEYLVQVRCALTSYPEWCMLCKENTKTLTAFIFEKLLCRWGPITEIVTNNGPAYRLVVDKIVSKYGIHPIHISPYNSQANGIVERQHHNVWEAIVKSCEGDDTCWYQVVHSVFWAEHVTIHCATGLSPYFMGHGIEPIFPFDLTEAMFLAPLPRQGAFSTSDLIAWCMRQLQKREADLDAIRDQVVKMCFKSICDFEQCFHATIKSHDFEPGALVLVHNSKVEYELSKKTKPCYLGPMMVVHRTKGGSYMLAELDGAISKLRFAAFRVIPYYLRSEECVSVTQMTGINKESIDQFEAGENIDPDEDDPERVLEE
jgi:hypothetical protein